MVAENEEIKSRNRINKKSNRREISGSTTFNDEKCNSTKVSKIIIDKF